MIKVPGKPICYRHTPECGGEISTDNGETWYFTFRSPEEFCLMHPTAVRVDDHANADPEDAERELFGETLDEPIPDDLWDMIKG